MFRTLSDLENFTQSQYQCMKDVYTASLKNHSMIRELNMLLTMLTEYNNTQSYIEAVNKGFNTPLVDIVLFCLFSNLEISVYYLSHEGLSKIDLKFGSQHNIKVYLTNEGYFDTMYEKSYIKTAGLCQSILLDVRVRC